MAREGAPSRRKKLETSKIDERRRYSTSAIKPPPVEVEIGGRWYEIDSDLDIDVMEQMLEIEEVVENDDGEDSDVLEALISGRDLVRNLLEESNKNVPTRLPLKAGQLLGIFSYLMGGKTLGDEVQEALAEGDLWGAERDGEPEGPQPESETDAEGDAAPLAQRSPRRSSRSAKRASGRATGGEASPGESSGSTSEKPQRTAATG